MFKSGEDISTEFIDYRNVDDSQILEVGGVFKFIFLKFNFKKQ